jgi:PDZ domain-containing protein
VQADGVTLYPSEGEVLYTTVSIGPLSVLERVIAQLDPDVDVVPKEAVLGTRTREENRQENLRVMGASKETATYVALRRLGYPVKVNGGGVLVYDIGEQYPAAQVLQKGDVITAVDGTPVQLPEDFRRLILARQPGEVVRLTVRRGTGNAAATLELDVTLAQGDQGQALVGVSPRVPADVTFEFPIDIEIDSGRVGGPSAGLAFTLTLLDLLTPGELTGGTRVAVTGAIDLDGNVVNVGGVRQKTVAAKEAGAELFLVPADELETAQREAEGSKLRVEGVRNLDDALAVLAAEGGNALALGTPGKS